MPSNQRLSRLVGALALALSFALSAAAQAQTDSPEAVVRAFYNGYVRQNAAPLGRSSPLSKYLSARLTMKKIKAFERETSADYFLQSQEWGDDWENRFTVSNGLVKGSSAAVLVTFPGEYPRVKVTLVKEKGAWKIAAVQNAPR